MAEAKRQRTEPLKFGTQAEVKALRPDPKGVDYVAWDRVVTGFGVRVRRSGVRSFVIVYRDRRTGGQRRLHLGRVDIVPLAMARKEAKRLLAKAALGKDPARELSAARRGLTVASLAEKWLAALEAERKKATTLSLYRHNLDKTILPKIGKRPARSIESKDVRSIYFAIKDTNPTKANRVVATLSAMLGWADRRDHLHSNVALGAIDRQDRAKEKADDRFLSEAETGRFLAACERLRSEGGHHGRIATAFELMLFCGLRPSDIFAKDGNGLKWSAIDFERRVIDFGDDQKAGTDPAYLRGPAAALLKSLDRNDDDVFVFPSHRKPGKALYDVRGTWEKVCELADFDDPRPAPKALRKTLATSARRWGFTLETIKPLLRHSEKGDITTRHYAHQTPAVIGDAAEEIANRLAGLGEPAKVVKLKTGAK